MIETRRVPLPVLGILVFFALCATMYSIVTPLFESPDEVWHYEFVRWFADGNRLPNPRPAEELPMHQEAGQPPLYYALAGLLTSWIDTGDASQVIVYNPHAAVGQAQTFGNHNMMVHSAREHIPWRGTVLAVHLARFFSILLGLVTVLFTYRLADEVFPGQATLALLAVLIVACNPQFIFISSSVNNDNLVTASASLALFLLVRLLRTGPSAGRLTALGVVLGIAGLSKLSALALFPLAALVLLLMAWQRRMWPAVARWGVFTFVPAALLGGWWYARNYTLTGDVLGLQTVFDVLPRRALPPSLAELAARAEGVWRSVWAVFGWFNVTAPDAVYSIYNLLAILGLVGCLGALAVWYRFNRTGVNQTSATDHALQRSDGHALALWLPVIWCGVVLLSLWQWSQLRYPQGRLLFPALSSLAVLWAAGINTLIPFPWRHRAWQWLGLILGALAVVLPWTTIAPAYAVPPAPTGVQLAQANEVNVTFGGKLRLRAFEIANAELSPGQPLALTLYWQALSDLDENYSVYLHLLDDADVIVAQDDSYPGRGNAATSTWQPGETVSDAHQMLIPETATAPCTCRLLVGVYRYTTGERLEPAVAQIAGLSDPNSIELAQVDLRPRLSPEGIPNPLTINFDDKIMLVGFDVNQRLLGPDDTLELTLYWRALKRMKIDYTVFTHLRRPGTDEVWAGRDSQPQDGQAPTTTWQPQRLVEDHYRLRFDPGAPPGEYEIEIGIYDPLTGDRLPVDFSDAGVVLSKVRLK